MNTRPSTPADPWCWPIEVTRYDRTPVLSDVEHHELSYLLTHHIGRAAGPWRPRSRRGLRRLTQPLHDACAVLHITPSQRCYTTRVLLHEMWQRGRAFWAWNETEWVETIGPTMPAFLARHTGKRRNAHTTRQPICGIAYLLGGFTAFDRFPGHSLEPTTLAATVFGPDHMTHALDRVMHVLLDWGYQPSSRAKIHTALAYALLRNRSPRLEDLTVDHLSRLYERRHTLSALAHLYPLSRALAHLHVIEAPLSRSRQRQSLVDRIDTTGVAPEWVAWCVAWYHRAILSPGIKKQSLYALLQIGRWLAAEHPTITSPAQWDYALAADFVAAVDRMKIGDWRAPHTMLAERHPDVGKPIMPRTKAGLLSKARMFFLDLQEGAYRVSDTEPPHTLPHRFNPLRALQTPRAIRNVIGPDPRIMTDTWWLKLLHAADTLDPADLQQAQLAMYPFELVHAIAVTWCLSGLRSDEIRRLRVGCVQTRVDDALVEDAIAEAYTETGPPLPDDALCFLRVPVNKTGTAFTKPVHGLVGRRITAWERVRPPQARLLDPKTNEMVDFLFAFRHRQIGPAYINRRLIPLLCTKANLPQLDARGKITSHRARATIASALYNAPDGLTIGELGEWLGHKDPRSTQHYAKLHPTRLAKSVARATKQSRLAQVLLDPVAAAHGEPALFYYLGEGSYCANPAWAACPHRMACLKCPMYVPKHVAQRIEARAGILHLLQEVPLTDEEKAVADGDVTALDRYIAARAAVSPPPVPDHRYIFNPDDQRDDSLDS